MIDVFISYKSERRKAAAHLAKILECYGYTVWYDYSLVKGRDFATQIDAKIREAKAVIVLWCSLSVHSEWVADVLLSESEREYVARAGTATPFWWGGSIRPSKANYDHGADPFRLAGRMTLPVKSFTPNPWGLYQVHGNVWNWVEDCWHDNYDGAPTDGSAWTTGDCVTRVLRGGSWFSNRRNLRAASRDSGTPYNRDSICGFRVARTLD